MFNRQYRLAVNLLLTADCLIIFPALWASYTFRHHVVRWIPQEWNSRFNPELLPFQEYVVYALAFLPVWVFLLAVSQRYSDLLLRSFRCQFLRIGSFIALAGLPMGFLVFSLKLEISRPIFFGFLVLITGGLGLNRVLLHWILRSRNINEHNQIRILVIGTGASARRIGRSLEGAEKWGYRVVGYVSVGSEPEDGRGLDVIGSLDDLAAMLLEDPPADELIFSSTGGRNLESFKAVIDLCEELGIRTRLATHFLSHQKSKVSLEYLEGLPLVTFSPVPEQSLAMVAKRAADFLVAAGALIVFSPLMLLTALAIKMTSSGPIFYVQERCGLQGRRFRLVKFRTMIEGAEDRLWEIKHLNEMDGPVFKMRDDPRVTPLGRILRKSSIDELPQLWNVIKGEMSLVGPRAPLAEEVRHYSSGQKRRLSVKPGITCLWQVSGRSNIDFDKWMAMDLEYIDNWSLWLDLQIILKTIPAVFTGKGAR